MDITRKDAVRVLKAGATYHFDDDADRLCKAYDMAIKSLEEWDKLLYDFKKYSFGKHHSQEISDINKIITLHLCAVDEFGKEAENGQTQC